MGGAYIHHGVPSVQVAGLSPLHAEQTLSWDYFTTSAHRASRWTEERCCVWIRMPLLVQLLKIGGRGLQVARVVAVIRGSRWQVYTTWYNSSCVALLL